MNLWKRIRTPLPLEDLAALLALRKKQRPSSRTVNLEGDLKRARRTHLPGGGTNPLPIDDIMRRMIARISMNGDCMELPVSKGHGYPMISIVGYQVSANRLSWVLFRGPLNGLSALHTCDNPACINPDHLFLGTTYDNMQDRKSKGRYNTVPKGEAVNTCKLKPAQVLEIRERVATGESLAGLSREFGVHPSAISLIRDRKNWKHI